MKVKITKNGHACKYIFCNNTIQM